MLGEFPVGVHVTCFRGQVRGLLDNNGFEVGNHHLIYKFKNIIMIMTEVIPQWPFVFVIGRIENPVYNN